MKTNKEKLEEISDTVRVIIGDEYSIPFLAGMMLGIRFGTSESDVARSILDTYTNEIGADSLYGKHINDQTDAAERFAIQQLVDVWLWSE